MKRLLYQRKGRRLSLARTRAFVPYCVLSTMAYNKRGNLLRQYITKHMVISNNERRQALNIMKEGHISGFVVCRLKTQTIQALASNLAANLCTKSRLL